MNTPILFDIDGTLIDTWHLKKHMAEIAMHELNISKEIYEGANKRFVESLEHPHDFHPTDFFKYLVKKFGSTEKYLHEKFYDPTIFETFVFADTLPALKKLAQSHALGIFSQGFTSFQMKKLELAGLVRYFDPKFIYIFRRKTSPEFLALVPKNSLIIDDSLDFTKALFENGFTAKLIDRESKSPRVKNRIISLEEL